MAVPGRFQAQRHCFALSGLNLKSFSVSSSLRSWKKDCETVLIHLCVMRRRAIHVEGCSTGWDRKYTAGIGDGGIFDAIISLEENEDLCFSRYVFFYDPGYDVDRVRKQMEFSTHGMSVDDRIDHIFRRSAFYRVRDNIKFVENTHEGVAGALLDDFVNVMSADSRSMGSLFMSYDVEVACDGFLRWCLVDRRSSVQPPVFVRRMIQYANIMGMRRVWKCVVKSFGIESRIRGLLQAPVIVEECFSRMIDEKFGFSVMWTLDCKIACVLRCDGDGIGDVYRTHTFDSLPYAPLNSDTLCLVYRIDSKTMAVVCTDEGFDWRPLMHAFTMDQGRIRVNLWPIYRSVDEMRDPKKVFYHKVSPSSPQPLRPLEIQALVEMVSRDTRSRMEGLFAVLFKGITVSAGRSLSMWIGKGPEFRNFESAMAFCIRSSLSDGMGGVRLQCHVETAQRVLSTRDGNLLMIHDWACRFIDGVRYSVMTLSVLNADNLRDVYTDLWQFRSRLAHGGNMVLLFASTSMAVRNLIADIRSLECPAFKMGFVYFGTFVVGSLTALVLKLHS